jgi:hypothetical protein
MATCEVYVECGLIPARLRLGIRYSEPSRSRCRSKARGSSEKKTWSFEMSFQPRSGARSPGSSTENSRTFSAPESKCGQACMNMRLGPPTVRANSRSLRRSMCISAHPRLRAMPEQAGPGKATAVVAGADWRPAEFGAPALRQGQCLIMGTPQFPTPMLWSSALLADLLGPTPLRWRASQFPTTLPVHALDD